MKIKGGGRNIFQSLKIDSKLTNALEKICPRPIKEHTLGQQCRPIWDFLDQCKLLQKTQSLKASSNRRLATLQMRIYLSIQHNRNMTNVYILLIKRQIINIYSMWFHSESYFDFIMESTSIQQYIVQSTSAFGNTQTIISSSINCNFQIIESPVPRPAVYFPVGSFIKFSTGLYLNFEENAAQVAQDREVVELAVISQLCATRKRF